MYNLLSQKADSSSFLVFTTHVQLLWYANGKKTTTTSPYIKISTMHPGSVKNILQRRYFNDNKIQK